MSSEDSVKLKEPLNFEAIGIYRSEAKAPYEAARQPLERIQTRGEVLLNPGMQFEQALEDLTGMERVWLIYVFHHNTQWKPKVLPPRGSDHKVGVFATRAPYRPNPIGISCVKLVSVSGLRLVVEGADLLDGSPVLDIKPYLPYADAFPESKTGWLQDANPYTISFSNEAQGCLEFLKTQGVGQMQDFIINQLEYDPLNKNKKRVSSEEDFHLLAYKTWRIKFIILNEEDKTIHVQNIFSAYSHQDLSSDSDPYLDKTIHQAFIKWSQNPK